MLDVVGARWWLCLLVACPLLVSCGKSDSDPDTSIKGQLQAAMKMPNLRKRSKALLDIADNQFERKDKLGAKATIGLAVAAAEEIKGIYDRGAALNSTAYAYGKHELVDQATDVLKKVSDLVSQVEETALAVALIGKMAEIEIRFLDHVNTGNSLFQEGSELADNASKPAERAIGKLNLAFHLHRLKRTEERDGFIEQAFVAQQEIEDHRQASDVTADMASRLLQMECVEMADRAFQSAEERAGKIEESLSQGYALVEIGRRLSRAQRASEANRVLATAREVARQVTDQGLRNELLKRIAE